MAIKKIPEKLGDTLEDFWGKHNLTTRIITLSSTLLLIIITLANLFGKNIPNFDIMFKTLSDMVLYITIAIILGNNGLKTYLNFKSRG